jgi:hypothetical protein
MGGRAGRHLGRGGPLRKAAHPGRSIAASACGHRATFPHTGAGEGSLSNYGVAIIPDRSGERALEGGPIARSTVRGEHMLDRPLEQRAQPLGDLLAGHAVR